jgi:hypothetical protein
VVERVVEARGSGNKGIVLLSSVGKVDVETVLLAVDNDFRSAMWSSFRG